MTHSFQLIRFSLSLLIITSSQEIHSPSQHPPSASMDLHYLHGCTTILEGLDDLYSKDDYSYSFAEWENLNPNASLLNYFENNKGLASKIYLESDYTDTWTMKIMLYDGDYINQKAAMIQIEIFNVQKNTILNQTNGTFTTNNRMAFTVSFGENLRMKSQTGSQLQDVTGQVTISFVDTTTNQPFSSFYQNTTSVEGYSFQLNFTSYDGLFSFKTSLFAKIYTTPAQDTSALLVAVALVILVISSWFNRDLENKVSLGSLQAFYASAAFMSMFAGSKPQYEVFSYFLLVVPAIANFAKFAIWICGRACNSDTPRSALFGVLMAALAGFFPFIPTVWINLFPSFVLLFPFIQKIRNLKHNQDCLNRFEVSNYLYVLLFMGYAFLYPKNIYRFHNVTVGSLTVGCIIFQLVCLVIMQKIVNKRVSQKQALLEDESMHTPTPDDQQTNRPKSEDLEDTPAPQKTPL